MTQSSKADSSLIKLNFECWWNYFKIQSIHEMVLTSWERKTQRVLSTFVSLQHSASTKML